MAKAPEILVTDHAVCRFLERVHAIDIEAIRQAIRGEVSDAIRAGACSLYRDGFTYVLQRNSVVTIVDGRMHNASPGVVGR